MKPGLIAIILSSLITAANAVAAPDANEIRAACKTLIYRMSQPETSAEELLVLNRTFEMICDKAQAEIPEAFFSSAEIIRNALADNAACVTISGFASSGSTGGWTHKQLDTFAMLNRQTPGGFRHSQAQRFLSLAPALTGLSDQDWGRYKTLWQGSYTPDQLLNAVEILKLDQYRSLIPDIQRVNQQLDSIDLQSLQQLPRIK
ncbi:MAG: hypothetical protein KDI36_04170 [Pseudomonadales bacterium]|nr:hypothetical protein [Pseudomonadales bacterium]